MSRWQDELDRVSWSELRLSSGMASDVPQALLGLAASTSRREAEEAYWNLDNSIVVQGNIFQAAEFAIPFLIAIAIDGVDFARELSLELLIQLAGGYTANSENAAGNDKLAIQCRKAAGAGLAFYYALLDSPNDQIRDTVVELIALVEEDRGRLRWNLQWVERHDPAAKIRELAHKLFNEADAD